MRHYAAALGTEQVSFSWRPMPPDTGGRGSYGHRHPGQEEIYFVISGTVTFKVGDDVFEAGPQTAVRMTGDDCYSVHNDTGSDAELLIFSTRLDEPPTEQQDRLLAQRGRLTDTPSTERLRRRAAGSRPPTSSSSSRQLRRPADRAAGTGARRRANPRTGCCERSSADAGRRDAATAWWWWRERASGELIGYDRPQPRRGRGRADRRGRLVDHAGAPGRGLCDRGRAGGDRLGLRASPGSTGSCPSPLLDNVALAPRDARSSGWPTSATSSAPASPTPSTRSD